MTDLVSFLTARLAEDEAAAKDAAIRSATWARHEYEGVWGSALPETILAGGKPIIQFNIEYGAPLAVDHVLRWDPARVLAETAAKRAIIEMHKMTAYPERWGELRHHPDDEAPAPPGPGWASRMPKRSHLGELTGGSMYSCSICDADRDYGHIPRAEPGCETLLALAAPYASHPDFDESWRT